MIPKADKDIPIEIIKLIALTGVKWRNFNVNNHFDNDVLLHWKQLINKWAEDTSLPLIIRNSRIIRGGITIHTSGREIVFCDNSPAKWIAENVFMKKKPTLKEIKKILLNDQLPFKFAYRKEEQLKAKYKCISENLLNKAGWKLCHIESVGLKNQKDIENQNLNLLKSKFRLLLDPNNFFIIPKSIGGLGEISWFIESQKLITLT